MAAGCSLERVAQTQMVFFFFWGGVIKWSKHGQVSNYQHAAMEYVEMLNRSAVSKLTANKREKGYLFYNALSRLQG